MPHRHPWPAVALSVLGVLIGALTGAVTPAEATTETFHYTGGEQTFVVPTGVYRIQVVAIGGRGGTGSGGAVGGEAGEASGMLSVSPGDTLYVEVGGNGDEGGFNGGGAGGATNGGATGGGASDIRTAPGSIPLTTEDTRLLIAAGGGGSGGHGANVVGEGGYGGNTEEPGEPDIQTEANQGGEPGTESGGGAGGVGEGGTGEPGDLGLGGAGANTSGEGGGGGGGGGGGYYGGGGGGAGLKEYGGGGGGGGVSKVPPLGNKATSLAPAKVEIGYFPPPSITITTPPDGATYTQGQPINANYSCLPGEGTSLKSCSGPVANGAPLDTSTPGAHTFTVEAEGNDSGKSSKSVSYTVVSPIVRTGRAFAAGKARVKGGKALLRLRCRGGGRCRGVVKLLVGRKLIGKAHFSIAADNTKVIRVRLKGRGKKLLARRHRIEAKLRGSGVKPRTVVLKQVRPHRRGR